MNLVVSLEKIEHWQEHTFMRKLKVRLFCTSMQPNHIHLEQWNFYDIVSLYMLAEQIFFASMNFFQFNLEDTKFLKLTPEVRLSIINHFLIVFLLTTSSSNWWVYCLLPVWYMTVSWFLHGLFWGQSELELLLQPCHRLPFFFPPLAVTSARKWVRPLLS